jgi:hypothetical protein
MMKRQQNEIDELQKIIPPGTDRGFMPDEEYFRSFRDILYQKIHRKRFLFAKRIAFAAASIALIVSVYIGYQKSFSGREDQQEYILTALLSLDEEEIDLPEEKNENDTLLKLIVMNSIEEEDITNP